MGQLKGKEVSHCRTCALVVTDIRSMITFGGSHQGMGRSSATGGQYDWRNPNRILAMQDSTDHREANVFRAHAAPHGVCDNLINAPKPLANLHQDGSPVNVLVEGLQARSRLKNDGSAAKVHHDGQPRGGEDRRLGEDPGIALGDEGQMYSGLPLSQWCMKERIN